MTRPYEAASLSSDIALETAGLPFEARTAYSETSNRCDAGVQWSWYPDEPLQRNLLGYSNALDASKLLSHAQYAWYNHAELSSGRKFQMEAVRSNVDYVNSMGPLSRDKARNLAVRLIEDRNRTLVEAKLSQYLSFLRKKVMILRDFRVLFVLSSKSLST